MAILMLAVLAAQWVVEPIQPMATARAVAWQFGTATALPSGEVLVLGGYDQAITPTRKAWIIRHQ